MFSAPLPAGWDLAGTTNGTPVDAVTTSFLAYITSFGLAGIGLLILFWLYVWPGKLSSQHREQARADLIEENQRLIAEKNDLARQRDEAVNLATEQLVPLLTNFVSVTSVLIPLLQQLAGRAGPGQPLFPAQRDQP